MELSRREEVASSALCGSQSCDSDLLLLGCSQPAGVHDRTVTDAAPGSSCWNLLGQADELCYRAPTWDKQGVPRDSTAATSSDLAKASWWLAHPSAART